MALPKVSRMKVRKVKKKRVRRPAHTPFTVKVPAWLTRCATMGYEIWSEKPERVPASEGGGFKVLVGWTNLAESNFYFRVPSIDAIPTTSPIHLSEGGVSRIWLNLTIVGKRKLIHVEGTKQTEDST